MDKDKKRDFKIFAGFLLFIVIASIGGKCSLLLQQDKPVTISNVFEVRK